MVHHTSPFLIAIPPIIYKFFKSSRNILWDLDIWPETLESLGIIKNKVLIRIIDCLIRLIYKGYDKILISSQGLKSIMKKKHLKIK